MTISLNQRFLSLPLAFIFSLSVIHSPAFIAGFGCIGIGLLLAERIYRYKGNKQENQHFWNLEVIFSGQFELFMIFYIHMVAFAMCFSISALSMGLTTVEWQASLFNPIVRDLLGLATGVACWCMSWMHYQNTRLELGMEEA